MVILDYKDEYRGLVLGNLAKHWIVGPHEEEWETQDWIQFLEENDRTVLAKHDRLGAERWRDVCATIVSAGRSFDDILIGIDEAHFVAPQEYKIPSSIKGLSTTGRGEGASSIWITQRLAEIDSTVTAECQSRMMGGFEDDADLGKLRKVVEYPYRIHNPQADPDPSTIPDELLPTDRDRPTSLQKQEDNGRLTGSEWIYSDDSGDRRRLDTSTLDMQTEHHGSEGKPLDPPTYR